MLDRDRRLGDLGADGSYTPEVVVNGRAHVVGSWEGAVRRAARQFAARQAFCEAGVAARRGPGDTVDPTISASSRRESREEPLTIAVVLYGDPAGESGHPRLEVVSQPHFVASPRICGATLRRGVHLAPEGVTLPNKAGVVVLVSDQETGEVVCGIDAGPLAPR